MEWKDFHFKIINSFSLLELIFHWIRDEKIYSIWKNKPPDAYNFESNKSQESFSHTCFRWKKDIESFLSTKWNKLFSFSCRKGDTRIWTGEKGFAVPRLTTRPCRQNDTKKYMRITLPSKNQTKRGRHSKPLFLMCLYRKFRFL